MLWCSYIIVQLTEPKHCGGGDGVFSFACNITLNSLSFDGNNFYFKPFLPCAPLSDAFLFLYFFGISQATQGLRGWHLWWMSWPQQLLRKTYSPSWCQQPPQLPQSPPRRTSESTWYTSGLLQHFAIFSLNLSKKTTHIMLTVMAVMNYHDCDDILILWWRWFGLAVLSSKQTLTWCLCWDSLEHPAKKVSINIMKWDRSQKLRMMITDLYPNSLARILLRWKGEDRSISTPSCRLSSSPTCISTL